MLTLVLHLPWRHSAVALPLSPTPMQPRAHSAHRWPRNRVAFALLICGLQLFFFFPSYPRLAMAFRIFLFLRASFVIPILLSFCDLGRAVSLPLAESLPLSFPEQVFFCTCRMDNKYTCHVSIWCRALCYESAFHECIMHALHCTLKLTVVCRAVCLHIMNEVKLLSSFL